MLSILILQKPLHKSKYKELSSCLDRRMSAWARGISPASFEGKTGAALDLLSNKGKSGILHVCDMAAKDDPASSVWTF